MKNIIECVIAHLSKFLQNSDEIYFLISEKMYTLSENHFVCHKNFVYVFGCFTQQNGTCTLLIDWTDL